MSSVATLEVGPAELHASFKLAMRRLAASVTILTTAVDGRAAGMTATAVTSLTAEPPALLACINRSASMHPLLALGQPVCVNLLGEHHAELSRDFGGGRSPETRFESGDWAYDGGGTPYLRDARVNLFCVIDGLFEYATHSILACKVDAVRLEGNTGPLLYGEGRFIPLPPVT